VIYLIICKKIILNYSNKQLITVKGLRTIEEYKILGIRIKILVSVFSMNIKCNAQWKRIKRKT
jgi:hypothetical protein